MFRPLRGLGAKGLNHYEKHTVKVNKAENHEPLVLKEVRVQSVTIEEIASSLRLPNLHCQVKENINFVECWMRWRP